MRRLDNKGFTLIEVLAVVVIIGIIGLISVPSVISIINTGKDSSYDILVKDITVAAIQLHEEVSFAGTSIYQYNNDGNTGNIISILTSEVISKKEKYYTVDGNLQTLVSNGFLTGTNNQDKINNENEKIITNPKTKDDIGDCEITITKIVDTNNFNTSYEMINNSEGNTSCPTSDEYNKALNIKQEGA